MKFKIYLGDGARGNISISPSGDNEHHNDQLGLFSLEVVLQLGFILWGAWILLNCAELNRTAVWFGRPRSGPKRWTLRVLFPAASGATVITLHFQVCKKDSKVRPHHSHRN